MVKVHQLVAAIATTITLSTSAYALNMGSISWKSSYGQPLDARIELSDATNIQASDIKAAIADSNAFSQAGLEYLPDLATLSFSTIVNPDGTGYIKITSNKPIREPFISLLLDVNWPNGNASKEYTILLDIPNANSNQPAVPATPAKTQNTKPAASAPAMQKNASAYTTKRGDTLWAIAESNYGKTLAAKASKAIYDKNPKAFINGNINSLLNSYALHLPSTQEVNAITVAQANEFLATSGKSGSTTPTTQKSASPAVTAKQDQALQTQLKSTEQDLEAARVENTVLNTELQNIESEIARLEQVSKERDEAIAKAEQAKLAAKQSSKPQSQQTQTNTAKATTPESKTPTQSQQPAQNQVSTANKQNTPPKENRPANTQPVKKPVSAPAPIQAPQETSPSFISSLLGNNLMLLAGGGVLLILCLVAVILRRKKAADDDAQVVDLSNITLDSDDLKVTDSDHTDADMDLDDHMASPLSQLGEGMGIIDKADIYLAYNHYDEAKELLTAALQSDPTNTELRLKLMEIYADQGDLSSFETEEQELLLLDPLAQPKIDSLKENYPTLFENDFSFSNNPTPLKGETASPFGQAEPKKATPDNDDSSNQDQEIDFSDFDFSEPAIAPVKKEEPKTEEAPAKKVSPIALLEDQDVNFELEKITPDTHHSSAPLFDAVIGEDFSSDSPTAAFSNEDQETIDNESVKFDLGFNEHNIDNTNTKNVDILSELGTDNLDEVIEKDQVTTKLELVHAYIDMGDTEGAQDLLKEIMQEGNDSQQREAQALLTSLNPNTVTDNELLNSVDHSNTALTELELGFELPPEDEVSTKLELANAYIEMGDKQGAKDILDEVLNEGNSEQKQKAQELLQSIS